MKGFRLMAVVPLLMMIASVWAGVYRYAETKDQMRTDLNRALQQVASTVSEQKWLDESLVSLAGKGVLTPTDTDMPFLRRIGNGLLRDTAHFSVCLLAEASADEIFSERATVCSDTLFCHIRQADNKDMVMAMKAFANPSLLSICSSSRLGGPFAAFLASFLLMGFFFRRENAPLPAVSPCTGPSLTLTPMQEQLLQLFRSAPNQTLTKEEICTALWPKKENAEDTLYTFISRMKTALKKQSHLQIQNRRGREYVLVDEDANA